jgi:peroxiredoxin Q/BCP
LASYARSWDRFEQAGLQVAAISVDSMEQQRAMVEKLLLPFPVLSDPEGEVIRTWGVWTDAEGGIARPSLFLLRPDGSIAYSYVGSDYADRPSDDELFAAAAAVAVG